MKVDELNALKTRVAGAFYESPGGDLDGMLTDLEEFIGRSGLFLPPAVRKTGSREHQIEARCSPVSSHTPVVRLADEMERVWMDDLRYDDFEAHALLITDTAIILDFLTVARSARLYVTGMIIATLEQAS
jgi:hypothetical protein